MCLLTPQLFFELGKGELLLNVKEDIKIELYIFLQVAVEL